MQPECAFLLSTYESKNAFFQLVLDSFIQTSVLQGCYLNSGNIQEFSIVWSDGA